MSLEVKARLKRKGFSLDVAFEAPADGVTALFGPSGAGKSTMLSIIAGLSRPDEGRIRVDDETLLDTSKGVDVAAEARRIGCVFQNPRLFPHLDVRANLRFGERRKAGRDGPRFEDTVDLLDLVALLDRKPRGLSGGEARRVAIGRALLAAPRLLMLDEPLAGLDGARRAATLALLERVRTQQGIPMLYVSHQREEIVRLADHAVMLDGGQVRHAGPLAETLIAPAVCSALGAAPLSVLDAEVVAQDVEWGLTDVRCGEAQFSVAMIDAIPGARLRLGVHATDVTLARQPPAETSANNVIEGTVEACTAIDSAFTDVRVRCGTQCLLARITRRSADRLALRPGDRLWAIVKATTVVR